MIQKIKTVLLTLMMISIPIMPVLIPSAVSADNSLQACNNISGNVASGVTAASGEPAGSTDCTNDGLGNSTTGSLGNIASKIVNILSVVVGAVAVIMIIIAGFRYITSGGSSDRIGSAKNSLIYALIGLVIVALAQVIVHYVLAQANSATS